MTKFFPAWLSRTSGRSAFFSNYWGRVVRDRYTKLVPLVRRDLNTDIGRLSAYLDVEQFGLWNTEDKFLKQKDCSHIYLSSEPSVFSIAGFLGTLDLSMAK